MTDPVLIAGAFTVLGATVSGVTAVIVANRQLEISRAERLAAEAERSRVRQEEARINERRERIRPVRENLDRFLVYYFPFRFYFTKKRDLLAQGKSETEAERIARGSLSEFAADEIAGFLMTAVGRAPKKTGVLLAGLLETFTEPIGSEPATSIKTVTETLDKIHRMIDSFVVTGVEEE